MVGHPSSLSSPRDCRLTTDSHRPPHPSEKKRTSSMPLGKLTPLFLLIMMLPSFSYCFTCPSPRGAWAPSASLLTLPPSLHCCAVAVVAIDNFLGPIKRSGLTKVMVFGQTSHIYIKTIVSVVVCPTVATAAAAAAATARLLPLFLAPPLLSPARRSLA